MEERALLGVITLVFIIGLWRRLLLAVKDPTPGGAVILTSTAYLVGATIVAWRTQNDTSSLVYAACAIFFLMYLVAFVGCSAFFRLRQQAPEPRAIPQGRGQSLWATKWVFFLVALLGCVAIIYATGTDRLLAALFRFVFVGDASESVLDLRIGLSSGEERWMAPGYVKQLRDILMPLGGLLVLFAIKRGRGGFVSLSLVLVPVIALLMISSGERSGVLLFLLAMLLIAARAVRKRNLPAAVVLGPLAVAVVVAAGAFFALTSSFTSRTEYENSNTALILADRVITRTPEENVLGARVWARGAPFPGAGWLSEIASVMPGTQKTLSNFIHQDLGGGDLGNSVLGTWIDVYYNFGWWLGLVAAFSVGVSIALFNHWVNSLREKSWSADVCGLWISICMLMVLSPFGFLLYGPFLLSAFLWLITKLERPQAAASVRNPNNLLVPPRTRA